MPRTLPRWMHLNHGRYYRYMNFDQIEEFVEVAEKVEV